MVAMFCIAGLAPRCNTRASRAGTPWRTEVGTAFRNLNVTPAPPSHVKMPRPGGGTRVALQQGRAHPRVMEGRDEIMKRGVVILVGLGVVLASGVGDAFTPPALDPTTVKTLIPTAGSGAMPTINRPQPMPTLQPLTSSTQSAVNNQIKSANQNANSSTNSGRGSGTSGLGGAGSTPTTTVNVSSFNGNNLVNAMNPSLVTGAGILFNGSTSLNGSTSFLALMTPAGAYSVTCQVLGSNVFNVAVGNSSSIAQQGVLLTSSGISFGAIVPTGGWIGIWAPTQWQWNSCTWQPVS
jgi:hypothetical protein